MLLGHHRPIWSASLIRSSSSLVAVSPASVLFQPISESAQGTFADNLSLSAALGSRAGVWEPPPLPANTCWTAGIISKMTIHRGYIYFPIKRPCRWQGLLSIICLYYRIFVTTPAPTVRPPSRMANRRPSSIAMGVIRLMVIRMLSPGITISTPSGR